MRARCGSRLGGVAPSTLSTENHLLPLAPRSASQRALVVVAAPTDLADYNLATIDTDGKLARACTALGDIPLNTLGDATGGRAAISEPGSTTADIAF